MGRRPARGVRGSGPSEYDASSHARALYINLRNKTIDDPARIFTPTVDRYGEKLTLAQLTEKLPGVDTTDYGRAPYEFIELLGYDASASVAGVPAAKVRHKITQFKPAGQADIEMTATVVQVGPKEFRIAAVARKPL